MTVAINLLHTLCTEVALGNHLHLDLCRLDTVALPNHRTKRAVAREVRVACHQQVTQIDTVIDTAVIQRIDCREETVHLLHGIGHEHSLEVITVLQSATDTCCDGIDILQDGGILDTHHVTGGLGLDKLAGEHVAEGLCLVVV